jgi:Spy/CpxP family protein refolding chaperone
MNGISSKKKNALLLTAAVAVLLLAGSQALAQRGEGPQRGHRFGGEGFDAEARLEHLTEMLDLTSEQQTQIEAIQTKGRAANQELRKEVLRLENQLEGELLKDEPSQKTVLDLTKKLGGLRTEMQTNRVSNRFAVRELLTPEQRDKMVAMGPGHGRGRGHGCAGCDGEGRGGRHGGFGQAGAQHGHGRGQGK